MNAVVSKVTSSMSSSATHMIRRDHGMVMAKFHRIDSTTAPSQKKAIVDVICLALEVHAQLEEEIFYPAAREGGIDAGVMDKNVPEHNQMRSYIERLRGLSADDPEFDQTLMELMRAVIHHVAEEETVLLPLAEQRLGEERLHQLGAQMTQRRLQLLAPHGGEMVLNAARAMPKSTLLMVAGGLLAGGYMVRRAMLQYRYAR